MTDQYPKGSLDHSSRSTGKQSAPKAKAVPPRTARQVAKTPILYLLLALLALACRFCFVPHRLAASSFTALRNNLLLAAELAERISAFFAELDGRIPTLRREAGPPLSARSAASNSTPTLAGGPQSATTTRPPTPKELYQAYHRSLR